MRCRRTGRDGWRERATGSLGARFRCSTLSRPMPGPLTSSRERSDGRFDYLFVESTGISEPLPAAETRLGRRTALTFPLFPPPQKN